MEEAEAEAARLLAVAAEATEAYVAGVARARRARAEAMAAEAAGKAFEAQAQKAPRPADKTGYPASKGKGAGPQRPMKNPLKKPWYALQPHPHGFPLQATGGHC